MLKVSVNVELNKARVELNPDQRGSVESFVGKMLLGERTLNNANPVKKIASKRIFGRREWTQQDEIHFMNLIQQYGPTSKNQSELLKIAGRELGRTPHSLIVRLSIIRRGKGLSPASSIPQIVKSTPNNSSPVNNSPSDLH